VGQTFQYYEMMWLGRKQQAEVDAVEDEGKQLPDRLRRGIHACASHSAVTFERLANLAEQKYTLVLSIKAKKRDVNR